MKYTSDIEFTKALESTDTSPIFWSWVWNGPLTREGIKQELDDFAEAGIHGLYIIPEPKEFRPTTLRTYLDPPYMSKEYLELYRYAVEYALSKGIKLWLYDEGGWPSGGACGLTKKVLQDSDPCVLTRREIDPVNGVYSPSPDTIAAFDQNGVRIKPGSPCDGKITEYFSEAHYCGVNLVDLTRKDVTRAFLSTTHEKYLSSLRDLVGERIPYMFTDEPKLVDFAWNDDLPSRFNTEFGYDILDYLPELFAPSTERGRQALIDYKKLLGILFDENFLIPCADWCHGQGMGLCGHLDQDNILEGSPAGQYGSGLRLLRHFDLPGVDVIWQQIFPGKPVDGFSFFPKLASSAARQSGSELSLSESFAVYGDGLTSDEMRYVINYQFWLGINVFNFMTLPYGREKALAVNMRPMPCPEKPGFFSMEHIYKPTELLSKLMSTGKRACDTALYLPSADISLGGEIGKKAADSFTEHGERLLAEMIDFDIIDDEAILTAKQSKEGLTIGRALYRHVVIPECAYMPDEVREIAKKYPGCGISLASCSRSEIRLTARQSRNEILYFVFNPAKKAIDFELDFDRFPPNARLDLLTGNYLPPDLSMTLESGEAAVFIYSDKLDPVRTMWQDMGESETSGVESVRRFRLTEEGVSSQPLLMLPDDVENFSGELDYQLKMPRGHRIKLQFDLPGRKIAIWGNRRKLGDCGCKPQTIELIDPPRWVTVRVSTTAVNELHTGMHRLSKVWDKAEYAFYNAKLMENERETTRTNNDRLKVRIFRDIPEFRLKHR